mmetsp:Transcript_29849/g.60040  ORF Transcript_29849/g.60040 Transcript_29849/m.60040 type:complete len:601 (+) Transcript_29849:147-1949(+)
MKLLRSTFIAFCLTPGALAFTATTNCLSKTNAAAPAKFTTQLQMSSISVKSPSGEGIPDEDQILKEKLFRQVLQEKNVVMDFLDFITEESIKATYGIASAVEEEETGAESFAEVLAEKAAEAGSSGDNIGLFGGGDADSSSISMEDIKETRYQPNLRSDLGSTVLVSGTADASLLKVLNNNLFGQDNINNFQFTKIQALVENVALAKKTAISREARYSGLLDKLSIEPSSGALPAAAELEGASSWIAQISSTDAATLLPQVAELAKNSNDLKHVIVLVTGVTSNAVEGWDALEAASGDNFQCTLVAVGELFTDAKEGGLYHVGKLADATDANFASSGGMSSNEVYQLLGHALALESTSNQALTAYSYSKAAIEAVASPYAEGEFTARDEDGNEIVDEMKEVKMYGRLLQGLREIGFTRTAELDVLVEKGLEGFQEFMANPPKREDTFTLAKASRDEQDEKIMAILEAEIAKTEAEKKAEEEAIKKGEIEVIAQQWAIKEYSLRSIGGDVDPSVTEIDFIKSVWDQALVEAENTYDYINSAEYKKQQEKTAKDAIGSENKLFWNGMDPLLRKKREAMVDKVKKQYMDLLSEEELEAIILSE